MKIYIAAPLFNEAERAFNEKVDKIVKECGHETFLPQRAGGCVADLPEMIEGMPKRKYLFQLDCKHLDWCEAVLAILDGRVPDEGTCFELGYCYAKGKRCIAYKTDARSFIDGYDNVMIYAAPEAVLRNEKELREYLGKLNGSAIQKPKQEEKKEVEVIQVSASPEENDLDEAAAAENSLAKQIRKGTSNGSAVNNQSQSQSDHHSEPAKEPDKSATPKPSEKSTIGHKPTIYDMRQYGKIMMQLLDEKRRSAGYAELEKMESRFPEAGVSLGQYYYAQGDQTKAKKHFKIAADAGIHEGEWSYACLMPHSYVPDKNNPDDVEYETYCLRAAEGGCPDAANEMGNICHRRDCLVEAAYWYGMAYFLEHPQAINSVHGIVRKWEDAGKPEEYIAGTANYTEDRHEAAICFLKSMTGENKLDDLMALCLAGDTLAGLTAAYFFEQAKEDELAYSAYNALAYEKHPHALRCYADMLLNGKGTARDINSAFKMYELAAYEGNAVSLYALGQRALKNGDIYLAAACFGQAQSRGMEMAGNMLANLADLK